MTSAERVLPARMCRNKRPKGAKKPRRQACSTGRRASSPGLGGPPNKRVGISKRIFPLIACPCYRNVSIKLPQLPQVSQAECPAAVFGVVVVKGA